MEKLIYSLWRPPATGPDGFRDALLGDTCARLAGLEQVHGLRLCVADSAVDSATGRRMQSSAEVPDAVLSLWVNAATEAPAWEPLIDAAVHRHDCYLVAEAEPLVSTSAHPSPAGERGYGMCHVVFMSRPAELDRETWLSIWKDSHTQVAIDTQSTFGYRQNVVVRALGDSPWHDAIVEENFPPEAMASDHAFYATGGDETLLQRHMTAMMESCARFIDFSRIDVLPMSEYLVKPLGPVHTP